MGWVESRGRRFVARYRDGGQVVTVGGFPTKAAARAYLATVDTDMARGTHIDPRGQQVLFADWATEWIAARPGIKASTAATDAGRLKVHLRPAFNRMQLGRITPLSIRRWAAQLIASGLAAKTVRNCHGLMHTIMRDAVDEGLIARNPCVGTPLPDSSRREMRFLTEPELERLVAATPGHYRPLILTLVGTGLRWGEAAGLKVGRVDVLSGHLTVAPKDGALHEVGGRLSYGSPKSKKSARRISLPAVVRDALVPLVASGGAKDPVFTTEQGALLRRGNFARRVWEPAVRKAGLPAELRMHDLRHTHAAWLISAGRPLTAVQRRLGHASITVTSDIYGHLLPEVDAAILGTLDAALPTKCPPGLLPDPVVEGVDPL